MAIPLKIFDRLSTGVKKFQPILNSAKSRDVNESDTVVIIADILNEICGFDKYSEITTEYVVKKTYCDLAIKLDGKIKTLIEAKAIGLDLKDEHVKQAVDYGANSGAEWVILTNGINWRIYKVLFSKPIDKELIYEFDFSALNPKNEDNMEYLYLISREGIGKSLLEDFHSQKQALSRFFIGQMLLTDTLLNIINRELKKVSPGVKIENDEIKSVLVSEVLKREVVEGDKAEDARKKIIKALSSYQKSLSKRDSSEKDNKNKEKNESTKDSPDEDSTVKTPGAV